MKKFKFRFEAVLLHKKRELELAQQQVAEIRTLLRKEQDTLTTFINRASHVTSTINNSLMQGNTINTASVNDANLFLKKIKLDVQIQKNVLQTVQEALNQALVKVTQKLHEKTIFEKLREREFKLYLQNYDKEQMKLIDDIASIKRKQEQIF